MRVKQSFAIRIPLQAPSIIFQHFHKEPQNNPKNDRQKGHSEYWFLASHEIRRLEKTAGFLSRIALDRV